MHGELCVGDATLTSLQEGSKLDQELWRASTTQHLLVATGCVRSKVCPTLCEKATFVAEFVSCSCGASLVSILPSKFIKFRPPKVGVTFGGNSFFVGDMASQFPPRAVSMAICVFTGTSHRLVSTSNRLGFMSDRAL